MLKRSCCMLVVLILALLLTACGKKTIVLKDYVKFEVTGMDTAGKAKCKYDWEKMLEDNLEAFGLDAVNQPDALMVLANLDSHLKGNLDREEGLSNGDQITFNWSVKDLEALEEKYNATFQTEDVTFTVAGLQEAQQFDPFDYLQISYDGISPKGSVRVSADSTLPVNGIYFEADRTSNLANGDTIVVTFGGENVKDLCFQKGYVPTQTEKAFTVEGLSEYLQTLDSLPEDAFQKMDKHAQECLTASYASSYSSIKNVSDLKKIELVGNYLLTPKDSSIWTSTNDLLYFVYLITAVDHTEGVQENQTFQYYWYASYKDIILLDDGTCSFNLGSVSIPDGSVVLTVVFGEAFAHGGLAYTGYEDLDSLFNKHVAAYIDKFKYESTVENQ